MQSYNPAIPHPALNKLERKGADIELTKKACYLSKGNRIPSWCSAWVIVSDIYLRVLIVVTLLMKLGYWKSEHIRVENCRRCSRNQITWCVSTADDYQVQINKMDKSSSRRRRNYQSLVPKQMSLCVVSIKAATMKGTVQYIGLCNFRANNSPQGSVADCRESLFWRSELKSVAGRGCPTY